VLVEYIIYQIESEREEEEENATEEGTSIVRQKQNAQDAMEITIPYLRNEVIYVDDMLGKVMKIRYIDHDVHDVDKLQKLAEDIYFINKGEIGPL
jgi:hypothetical protein